MSILQNTYCKKDQVSNQFKTKPNFLQGNAYITFNIKIVIEINLDNILITLDDSKLILNTRFLKEKEEKRTCYERKQIQLPMVKMTSQTCVWPVEDNYQSKQR